MLTIATFLLGLFWGNFIEWFVHKHIFHRFGKNKNSIWSYHLKQHHVLSRKNNFIDLTASKVEIYGLVALMMLHLPILWLSIGFWAGVNLYAILFRVLHGYQHSNPEFTRKWMRWHWSHHMGDSNKNFGVVVPWCDYLFGTHKKY